MGSLLGPRILTLLLAVVLVAAFAAASASLCGGKLVYTLDDAYIHLAMSEQISAGGYGVNPGETASACSSVVYPLLLVPGAGTGLHEILPLVVNALALLLTLHLIWNYLVDLGFAEVPGGRALCAAVVLISIPALNLLGLVFTGMEHSLHVLAAVAVLSGVARYLDSGRIPWTLAAAVVLGPLVRYEALAASLAAVLVLGLTGARRAAAVLAVAFLAPVAGFTLFLVSKGLPPLPSSVLVKSAVAASGVSLSIGGVVSTLIANLKRSLLMARPGILLGSFFVAVSAALVLSRRRGRTALGLYCLLVVGAHLLVGRYDWFNRYEAYVVATAALAAVGFWREAVLGAVRRAGPALSVVAAVLIGGFVGLDYLAGLKQLPAASNNIYEQHHQMHRFVTEHLHEDVAVNDLGWVAYRNPNYVLDLWGLASESARRARADGLTVAEMEALIGDRDISVVMIYETWFTECIPEAWTRVARLHLSRRPESPSFSHVEFFVTRPERVAGVRRLLADFAATLPPGPRLEILVP
jgi:hypothetical protein